MQPVGRKTPSALTWREFDEVILRRGPAGQLGMAVKLAKAGPPMICGVVEGGPAHASSLRNGDMIEGVGGRLLTEAEYSMLPSLLASGAGARNVLWVTRSRERSDSNLQLGSANEREGANGFEDEEEGEAPRVEERAQMSPRSSSSSSSSIGDTERHPTPEGATTGHKGGDCEVATKPTRKSTPFPQVLVWPNMANAMIAALCTGLVSFSIPIVITPNHRPWSHVALSIASLALVVVWVSLNFFQLLFFYWDHHRLLWQPAEPPSSPHDVHDPLCKGMSHLRKWWGGKPFARIQGDYVLPPQDMQEPWR